MITFDPDTLRLRVAELEEIMGEPGFWDDQQRAAALSAEHSRLSKRLERYERLAGDVSDLEELLELASADGELDELEGAIGPLQRELARLEEAALFRGEFDAGDAVLTIHAGTGGTDAQDWTEMLLRMYLRWAADRGFRADLIEASPGEEAGLKSATATVAGENAYGILKAERGVHRLVRLSPFDQAHRRHTSFAQVIVSPLIPDTAAVEIDEGELRIDTYRASGAGGQHVNKTDSAVRITHLPTGVVVQCQNERSQLSNKLTALRILKSRLVELEQERREAELAAERGGGRGGGGVGRRARRRAGHRFRQPDPQLRVAALPAREGSSHRFRGREHAGGAGRASRRVHPRLPARAGGGQGRMSPGFATLGRGSTLGAPPRLGEPSRIPACPPELPRL